MSSTPKKFRVPNDTNIRIWPCNEPSASAVALDGSPDKNVFDIQQGIVIIIVVMHNKDGKKYKPQPEVLHERSLGGV